MASRSGLCPPIKIYAKCTICQDRFPVGQMGVMACGHAGCLACLTKWWNSKVHGERRESCAMCRMEGPAPQRLHLDVGFKLAYSDSMPLEWKQRLDRWKEFFNLTDRFITRAAGLRHDSSSADAEVVRDRLIQLTDEMRSLEAEVQAELVSSLEGLNDRVIPGLQVSEQTRLELTTLKQSDLELKKSLASALLESRSAEEKLCDTKDRIVLLEVEAEALHQQHMEAQELHHRHIQMIEAEHARTIREVYDQLRAATSERESATQDILNLQLQNQTHERNLREGQPELTRFKLLAEEHKRQNMKLKAEKEQQKKDLEGANNHLAEENARLTAELEELRRPGKRKRKQLDENVTSNEECSLRGGSIAHMPAMHVDEYEDPLARRIKGFGSASSGLGRQADTYVRPKPVGLTRHPSLVLDVKGKPTRPVQLGPKHSKKIPRLP